MSGKESQGSTRGLEFIGERDRPMRPDEIARLRPALGEGRAPKELRERARRGNVYVTTRSEDETPKIDTRCVGREGDKTLWELSFEQREGQRFTARHGLEATREQPEYYLRELDPTPDFKSFRPEWEDLLPTPRVLPLEQPSVRRINGRFLRPHCKFGPTDGRVPFMPNSWPWRCIGRVNTSMGTVGTATLVSNNMIVTAGHMVPATAWLGAPWWIRFVPGYYDGTSMSGKGVQSYVSNVKGWSAGSSPTGYDWVIGKLYEPLGDSLGWFGYNGYSDDWEDEPYWSTVGYPGDVTGGERPTLQTSIRVFDDDSDSHGGRELEHRGDSTDGNSGGPFFSWWKNGTDPRVVAVSSGCEEDYIFPFGSELGNVAAGGSGFTSLISWGRTHW